LSSYLVVRRVHRHRGGEVARPSRTSPTDHRESPTVRATRARLPRRRCRARAAARAAPDAREAASEPRRRALARVYAAQLLRKSGIAPAGFELGRLL